MSADLEIPTDLHGHTLHSDGRATPEAFADFRRQLGMAVIAVSDHDLLAAVRPTASAARAAGMLLIPALEVTSFIHHKTDRAEQIHLLAYFPVASLDGPRLEATFLYRRGLEVQAKWRTFVLAWLDGLGPEDRAVVDPANEFPSLPPARFPALQSCIDRFVERERAARGPTPPRPTLFERFRDHHWTFWDDEALFAWSPEEAMDAIRADGAIDVVAHAARYRDKDRLAGILDRATGIEAYTSRHKPELAEHFRELAERKGKLWTASSDDHQNARYLRPPRGTPRATVERLVGEAIEVEVG